MGKMINWKVRLKNRNWVIAFISQIMIVAQMVLAGLNSFGLIDFQLTDAIQNGVLTFVNAVFVLMSMLGIVQDPTTKGYRDSERALTYKDPN
ncbi:phage holin [Neobacillus drentensis]|jgi:phi LC3 family holin|uniref:phage holin n=2 Tax=Neobacillus drentensis TaxID=220684 RepID=UPI0026C68714